MRTTTILRLNGVLAALACLLGAAVFYLLGCLRVPPPGPALPDPAAASPTVAPEGRETAPERASTPTIPACGCGCWRYGRLPVDP
jgi:hypothetical protein